MSDFRYLSPSTSFLLMSAILFVQSQAHTCRFSQFSPGKTHTACLPPNTNCNIKKSGVTQADQIQILNLINQLREKTASGKQPGAPGVILPSSNNLRQLRWSNDLALIAQAHTNQCKIGFDCFTCRSTEDYLTGETIYYFLMNNEAQNSNWAGAIAGWSDSKTTKSIKAGQYPSSSFAQLVWGQTKDVGCGYTEFFNSSAAYRYTGYYTCVFGPSGLTQGFDIYEVGNPCGDCTYRNTCCGSSCQQADYPSLCKLIT